MRQNGEAAGAARVELCGRPDESAIALAPEIIEQARQNIRFLKRAPGAVMFQI